MHSWFSYCEICYVVWNSSLIFLNAAWSLTKFFKFSTVWSCLGTLGALTRLHGVEAPWWRHQMETFSALLALCAGNSPVIGEFPAQRPVTRSFDVFFDLRLNKRLSKQSWGWWFETPSHPLWRHSKVIFRTNEVSTMTNVVLSSATMVLNIWD